MQQRYVLTGQVMCEIGASAAGEACCCTAWELIVIDNFASWQSFEGLEDRGHAKYFVRKRRAKKRSTQNIVQGLACSALYLAYAMCDPYSRHCQCKFVTVHCSYQQWEGSGSV